MTQKEELAALKKRVAELEAMAKPPEPAKPFVPEPPWHYDPTANMSMPPSALREMVNAVPDNVIRDIAMRDNRGPTGRPGMIPSSHQQPTSLRPSAGDGTGWAREIPLGPSMHQRYVDQQLDAAAARDKAERIQQATSAETARRIAEQGEKLERLIEQNKRLMGKIK